MEEVTLEQSIELRGRIWTVRHWRDQDGGQGHSAPREKVYDEQHPHTWVCRASECMCWVGEQCGREGMYVQSDKMNLALFPVLLKTFKEKSIFYIINDIIQKAKSVQLFRLRLALFFSKLLNWPKWKILTKKCKITKRHVNSFQKLKVPFFFFYSKLHFFL